MIHLKPLPPIEELKASFAYDPETGQFIGKRGPLTPSPRKSDGYVQLVYKQKRLPAHRVAYALQTGSDPYPHLIDHINRIKHDNRFENLRLATNSSNMHNSEADEETGVKKTSIGWKSTIHLNGVRRSWFSLDLRSAAMIYAESKRIASTGEDLPSDWSHLDLTHGPIQRTRVLKPKSAPKPKPPKRYRPKNSSGKYIGLSKTGLGWCAWHTKGPASTPLGTYPTQEAAALIRYEVHQRLHPELDYSECEYLKEFRQEPVKSRGYPPFDFEEVVRSCPIKWTNRQPKRSTAQTIGPR